MRIGHASTSNTNNASQVCIASWYNKNWDYVLRPKDLNIANRMAKACEDGCNNDYICYSQNQRNTLKLQALSNGMDLSKIKIRCFCDCSSFMTVCAECAGISIPYNGNNAPTTSTMKTAFTKTNMFDLFMDKKYLTSDKYLKRGDILVKEGSHTVMILEDGSLANNVSNITSNTNIIKAIKAIDLSKYNVINNYIALSKEIQYVIIRIGYRSYESGRLIEDTSFKTHISQCKANGMKVGVYFYDQSKNEAEAIEQAVWVVNTLKPYGIDLPIYIDSEYSNKNHNGRADNISKEQRTKNILAFCNKIIELGYNAGVYASNSWFKSMLIFDQIKYLNIWCARYSTNNPTVSKYDIWQYGSELFNWANGAIDVNYIYNLPSDKPNAINGEENSIKQGIKICNTVNVNTYLNVRLLPNSNADIIGKLYNADNIEIFGYVNGWYAINSELSQWVSSKYIITNKAVTTANLNYRCGAGTKNVSLGIYNKGTIVKVLNKLNEWYLCLDSNNRCGWCSGKYLNII